MENLLLILISGATGGAIIKMIDHLLMWNLNRKATKEDDQIKFEKEIHNEINDIKETLKIILVYDIQEIATRFIKEGNVTLDERRRLHAMHKAYHDNLNGNGDLDDLMEAVDEIPFV